MKEYLQRLKNHPGIIPAIVFNCLFVFAALSNTPIKSVFETALLVGTLVALPFYIIILIINKIYVNSE